LVASYNVYYSLETFKTPSPGRVKVLNFVQLSRHKFFILEYVICLVDVYKVGNSITLRTYCVNKVYMTVTSLIAIVAPRTRKITKNGRSLFEKGEHLLKNGILYFVIRLSQSSEIALES